jgi:hypothetical protein
MSTRSKQFQRRLARVEASLGKRSQSTGTSLAHRVTIEAQQELSPEELLLYKSAVSARSEGRFHSLEEHAVMKKFDELLNIVARRYGSLYYGGILHRDNQSRPRSKPSTEDFKGIVATLNWGRLNSAHLRSLELAREASQANGSASHSGEAHGSSTADIGTKGQQ